MLMPTVTHSLPSGRFQFIVTLDAPTRVLAVVKWSLFPEPPISMTNRESAGTEFGEPLAMEAITPITMSSFWLFTDTPGDELLPDEVTVELIGVAWSTPA